MLSILLGTFIGLYVYTKRNIFILTGLILSIINSCFLEFIISSIILLIINKLMGDGNK